MQNRSDMSHDKAGIIFTGCEVTRATQPQPQQQAQAQAQAAPRRREVVVGGRRVKTIDVHAHCVVPKALELMGRTSSANEMRGPGISEVGMRRLREMDEQAKIPGMAAQRLRGVHQLHARTLPCDSAARQVDSSGAGFAHGQRVARL